MLGDDETPIYHIRFKGDAEGAAAAFQLWGETVTRLGGTRRIFAGQLRGSDGTHLTFLNEGSAREVEAMPQDLKDMILRELDPNQT